MFRSPSIGAVVVAVVSLGLPMLAPVDEAAAKAARGAEYRFVELGRYWGERDFSIGRSIDEHSEVLVSGCLDAPQPPDSACFAGTFSWDDGRLTPVGKLGLSPWTQASAMNDRGVVVGSAGSDGFLWRDGVLQKVPIDSPSDINNKGWVVGGYAR